MATPEEIAHVKNKKAAKLRAYKSVKTKMPKIWSEKMNTQVSESRSRVVENGIETVTTGGCGSGTTDASPAEIESGGLENIPVIHGFEDFCEAVNELHRIIPDYDFEVTSGSGGPSTSYAVAKIKDGEGHDWSILELHIAGDKQTYTLVARGSNYPLPAVAGVFEENGNFGETTEKILRKLGLYKDINYHTLRHYKGRTHYRWALCILKKMN